MKSYLTKVRVGAGCVLIAASTMLASCGLPKPLRQEIASEKEKLQKASAQFQNAQDTVRDRLANAQDLFRGSAAVTEWPARFRDGKSKLDKAVQELNQLENLQRSSGAEAVKRAERLLNDERQLREQALSEAETIRNASYRWLEFKRDPARFLSRLAAERDAVVAVDLGPATHAVEKAERDWPSKKADLDRRLAALTEVPQTARLEWSGTEDVQRAAIGGTATAVQIETLIKADDRLAAEAVSLPRDAKQLSGLCDQLYNAWDKVLDDLDTVHRGDDLAYREKIKTIRTRFIDVPEKKTETSSDVRWEDVSAAQYRSVENDLGMAISHKDAGFYDSEAQNVAQPAGFAYIAPPEVGSNQYGYWSHTDHGSFWTFLPQYLIMRELLWGPSYRPIVINEYNGYYQARSSGRTYYGQETPSAAPKYGSHGTFTEQRYAGSRYVQSGGFKGSGYASRNAGGGAPAAGAAPRFGSPGADNSQGRRFGHGADAPAQSGRRFGSGGSSPPPSSGRRFGSGGGSRSFGSRRR